MSMRLQLFEYTKTRHIYGTSVSIHIILNSKSPQFWKCGAASSQSNISKQFVLFYKE